MGRFFAFWVGISLGVYAQIPIPTALSATFVQKVTTPSGKKRRYEGNVRINRTREFQWVYTRPASKIICGDGRDVRIVDHELEQVIVYRVGSLLDLMQLLKRAKPHHDAIYTATYHGVTYTLKLSKAGQIEQVAYTDETDNVVQVRFGQVRYRDRSFSRTALQCPQPKGYDIIKGKSRQ
jgi:outer membrane lipoprotein carrier protein